MTRFLPAEVIVLIDAGDTAGDLSQRRLRRVYEGAMDWLNESVQGLLQRPPPPSYGSPFEQDMAPVTLRQICQGAPQVLTPPPVNGGRSPWVHLPASGKLLCFFGLSTRDGRWPQGTGDEAVRELVNLINRRLQGRPFPERGARPTLQGRVLAATPHWLAAGTQATFTDGGPAARPIPASGGRWRFDFHDDRLDRLAARPGKGDVVVAVLDTSPTLAQVRRAARRYPDNWLLQDLVGPGREFTIDEALSVPGRLLRHLDAFVPSWRGDVRASADGAGGSGGSGGTPAHLPSERYLMPDHGLFSASIVRQLAPHAEIRLVRVLSDYGVGDLLALTDVLGRLPAALNPRGDRRLVVNLSLVAGMPPSREMLSLWFPHAAEDPPTVRSLHVDMYRALDFAHRSLAETISWLTAQGVLVVAAAGNDAGDAGVGTAPLPPEPRIPARYEDVLAVAAVKRSSF
ncbi:MAG TPA: hypothetical protein VH257_09215, partial [Chloroflexota bacterium]|nr:hypothetical protein [Chloroflexota bacterium]